ncbi:MAG: hypothetical protein QXS43_12010 [Metallosphaera sp.]|uniref:hypothetical protein n=1 Tax=Metallosphaera sp. TaxID=2020860 RepID=UPI00317DCD89
MSEIVEISLPYGTFTNTFYYSLLYSLKKMDFVKGYSHKGLEWSVDYKVKPGKYVIFDARGYLDERGATLTATLVNGNIEEDKAETNYVVPGHSSNPVVQAFLDARPAYHGKLVIPSLQGKGTGWEEIKKAIEEMNEATDPDA